MSFNKDDSDEEDEDADDDGDDIHHFIEVYSSSSWADVRNKGAQQP